MQFVFPLAVATNVDLNFNTQAAPELASLLQPTHGASCHLFAFVHKTGRLGKRLRILNAHCVFM